MKPKSKSDKILLIVIAILAAAIIGVVIFSLCTADKTPEDAAPQPVPTPRPQVVYREVEVEKLVEVEKEIGVDVIQDGLHDMGILITEEYYFTDVVSFSSVKKLFKTDIELNFTESNYLASYDGVVTAGLDFAGITVEMDTETRHITVRIPKAEIQNVDIDPESFTLYSEKVGFSNPFRVEDFNNSLVELEKAARTKAVDKGLLTRADENAISVISNFVSGLVDTSVYHIDYVTK